VRRLIPDFIHEQYLHQSYSGHYAAATMFVDISGFTQLTEMLMQGGEEGAEVLSEILNRGWTPTVEAVTAHGGFIANFAGDAFTAVLEQPLAALACAQDILSIFAHQRVQRTRFGKVELQARIGLAYGEVSWGIAGQEDKAYFFRGPAIERCAQAEQRASQGEVVLTQELAHRLRLPAEALEKKEPGYLRLVETVGVERPDPVPPSPSLRRKVLARFLPTAVLDFDRTGEFRNVVAIFISFAGLSTQAELDQWVAILLENAGRFAGYLNKLDFGDKGNLALCLFGAPVAHEDNVARAIDFLHAVQQDIAQQREVLPDLRWRAGVTYGTVYAGLIGGEDRCEYTAIGGTINMAARLMSTAEWGQAWTDERVRHRAQDRYLFQPLGELSLKGMACPAPIYRLGGQITEQGPSFEGHLFSREVELAQVAPLFQALLEERVGGLLYVYGEAGVGKSRLVYELRRRYSQCDWLDLPCDGILQKAFAPFLHMFSHMFEQSSGNSLEQNQAHFETGYRRLVARLEALGDPKSRRIAGELVRLQSLVAGFLGLPCPGTLYEQLEPELRYQNTLAAFQELLRARSLLQPLILTVEDVQWIDQDTAQAIGSIYPEIAHFPILLVATSRYGEDHGKPRLPLEVPAVEIDLDRLPREGVQALAEEALAGPVTPRLLGKLVARTEGNPFFVEQTVRFFREAGVVALQEQATPPQWDLVQDEPAIPATINDLLIARVDRLSARLKHVVQTAAVIGHVFSIRLVADVLRHWDQSMAAEEVQRHLQSGIERSIWAVLSELDYLFSHALLRDAVYRMQLRRRLRRLHRLVAESLERLFPGDRNTFADLAFHYQRAELIDQAIVYLHKAGDLARDNYTLEMATAYYRQALDLLPEAVVHIERRLTLLKSLGENLQAQARYDEAIAAYTTMREVAREIGDGAVQAQGWIAQAYIHDSQGHYRAALECGEQAEAVARAAGAEEQLSSALFVRGFAAGRLGEIDTALALGEEALALSTRLGARHQMGLSLNLLGTTLVGRGQYQRGIELEQRSLALWRELGDRRRQVSLLNNIGVGYGLSGDTHTASGYYEKALHLAREIGYRSIELLCLSNLGVVRVEMGHYQKAEADLRQLIEMAEQAGAAMFLASAYSALAVACLHQGRIDEALETGRYAVILALESEAPEDIGVAWRTLGMIAARLDEPVTIGEKNYSPQDCFAASRETLEAMGAEGERARTLYEWGCYEREQGNREKGAVMQQEAREIFERLKMTFDLEKMAED